ncbi:MAG: hypothetical protein R3B49_10935 [Phycisphaerales bacterium]
MHEADYQRIEREITCDASPVGIDARKTHVLILGKLEAIERRLDGIERRTPPDGLHQNLTAGLGAATDTFDDEVARLRARGVDVDERLRAGLRLLERLTDERVADALSRIVSRLESLEPMTEMATHAPDALAAATDAFDEEVARAAERGIDVDTALHAGSPPSSTSSGTSRPTSSKHRRAAPLRRPAPPALRRNVPSAGARPSSPRPTPARRAHGRLRQTLRHRRPAHHRLPAQFARQFSSALTHTAHPSTTPNGENRHV